MTKGNPELEAQLKIFAGWLIARGYTPNARYVAVSHVRRYCREYGELGPTDRATVAMGSSATHGAAASALRRWAEWREACGLPYHRLDLHLGTLPEPLVRAVRDCTEAGRLVLLAPLLAEPVVLILGLEGLCGLYWHPADAERIRPDIWAKVCTETGLQPEDMTVLEVPGQAEGSAVFAFLPARSAHILGAWGRGGLRGLAPIEAGADPGAIAPPAPGAPLLPAVPGAEVAMQPALLLHTLIRRRRGRPRAPIAPVVEGAPEEKGAAKGAKPRGKKT